ncbi:probable leucine-rich repeat receptor-like protein kinase At5g49770 [Camellia sinensis]|uniref:probable leucine-rich repeat receptor-like protein kinase At5g49770 n=1 Tax=Camellia sinensis TaxID=4442 RepID=UPI0010363705|nr:probable leucine-rich repeat receptor-like protein kinase At5g49770 [Camellia sinensis]
MGPRFQVCLFVIFIQILVVAASTNSIDVDALNALKSKWKNTPPNWVGSDPCGSSWDGISCNNSRVTSMVLAGMDLTGSLSNDILSLSELQYLDLSNNKGLTGTLPSSIGNLNQLTTLILIGCSFFGPIPDSIGSLQQLVFLALNANSFSGPIPPSIGYVQTLEAICFNWNSLNGPVPSNLNNLTSVRELYLSNNNLNGPSPNLTGMNFLNSLDMSNNSFNSSADHPWHTSLEALTTLLVFDDVWSIFAKQDQVLNYLLFPELILSCSCINQELSVDFFLWTPH